MFDKMHRYRLQGDEEWCSSFDQLSRSTGTEKSARELKALQVDWALPHLYIFELAGEDGEPTDNFDIMILDIHC